MTATYVNDTHISCPTPVPDRVGGLPLRFEVGDLTAAHPAHFPFFEAYDVEDSYISKLRLQPMGAFPVGGAYNLPHTLYASGRFDDYGTPRCRFRSTETGANSGGTFISEGGVVANTSYLSCDKPRFPDAVRDAAYRYEVAFAANGQCFRPWVEEHANNAFFATNTQLVRIAPTAMPLKATPGGGAGTPLTIHGDGLLHPNLPDAVCRFTRLTFVNYGGGNATDVAGLSIRERVTPLLLPSIARGGPAVLVDGDGDGPCDTCDDVVLTAFTSHNGHTGECTPPGLAGEEGMWTVELLQNGLAPEPSVALFIPTFVRYDASDVGVTRVEPPKGSLGEWTNVTVRSSHFPWSLPSPSHRPWCHVAGPWVGLPRGGAGGARMRHRAPTRQPHPRVRLPT